MDLAAHDFEDEVRRIARELWPSAQYDGAAMVADRERDGIFETEWMIHLVEATTSRGQQKAKQDIGKLTALRRQLRNRRKPIQCWFVTQDEPTADQRSEAPRDGTVRVLSFEQFRSQLIDAHAYLRDRDKYAFGSVRDTITGALLTDERFMPLDLISSTGAKATYEEICDRVSGGGRFVLLGDYGAGKSMTLRELHRTLATRFGQRRSQTFPIHLNLRDHPAQTDPAEALHRHGSMIGFGDSHQLVRAWRAGYAHILLDGFDEMATPGWVAPASRMRDARRRSVELVRRFVKETPRGVGIVVVGREHYFDSPQEMAVALGTELFVRYSLAEFTDEDISEYLALHDWNGALPEWLPGRPLLLSYLARRGLLTQALSVPAGSPPAMAWDSLLDLICIREADIEVNADGATVRRMIERIASVARARGDGLGPLEFRDIEDAFRDTCGYAPDDRAMVLLQRLPGLGPQDPESGTRRFVDPDLADAARAGDLTRFVINPFSESPAGIESWRVGLGALGVDACAYQLARSNVPPSKVAAGVQLAIERNSSPYLAADLVRVGATVGFTLPQTPRVYVEGVWIDQLVIEALDSDLSGVEFRDCVFELLEVPLSATRDSLLPTFVRCHFGSVEGRRSNRDVPAERFKECVFDSFGGEGDTTSALLAMALPLGQRVALTVLKKLYLQRGSGRREGALFRGLSDGERAIVPEVLEVLESHKLAIPSHAGNERLWLPVRRMMPRIRAMVDGPSICTDDAWLALSGLH